ncbi:hypothetical protein [Nonomuraea sp. NPDC050202]|uniref:hypothetical protein n=1 Tax=Nonomuraea sp. NPDC050202 TaxID=3155035 RepID=UPI0033E4D096
MARTVRCDHAQAVPVESVVTGEILAALCPGCDQQLPAEFLGCPHDNAIDITNLAELPGQRICNDCGTTGWYGQTERAVFLPLVANPAAPTQAEILRGIPLSWL